ncbi:MAG: hypothetical protein ABI597_06110 [Gammaproteobacteria bacterium]
MIIKIRQLALLLKYSFVVLFAAVSCNAYAEYYLVYSQPDVVCATCCNSCHHRKHYKKHYHKKYYRPHYKVVHRPTYYNIEVYDVIPTCSGNVIVPRCNPTCTRDYCYSPCASANAGRVWTTRPYTVYYPESDDYNPTYPVAYPNDPNMDTGTLDNDFE